MSGRPSSQSRRLYQQHQHQQHEYYGVGGLGIEVFGQALDHPEREAGDDGTHDGTHAADYDHGEHDDDEVGAHQRADLVDRRRQHAGKRGKTDAETISERDHAGHVDAEGADQRRVFGGGAQVSAEPRLLDQEPGGNAHHQREDHHPAAVDRQEHEAEIDAALQAAPVADLG